MRLTYRINDKYELYPQTNPDSLFDKLGRLEDIAELCEKIESQQKVCPKNGEGKLYDIDFVGSWCAYDFITDRIIIIQHGDIFAFKMQKYGRTWAVTKGELQ